MKEYRIFNVKDHILIEDNGEKLLIDTGSPFSFHEAGRMTICGLDLPVPRSLPEADPKYISEQLGVHVSGLVGMDFIGKHPMLIDINAESLIFDCDTEGYSYIPSSSVMGCIKINMSIEGTPASIILDTGAPTSYISRKFTEGKTAVDSVSDFSPYCGAFETPVYELAVSVGGRDFTVRAGNLPAMMGLAVGLLADGVFGMDFFKNFKVLISNDGVFMSV